MFNAAKICLHGFLAVETAWRMHFLQFARNSIWSSQIWSMTRNTTAPQIVWQHCSISCGALSCHVFLVPEGFSTELQNSNCHQGIPALYLRRTFTCIQRQANSFSQAVLNRTCFSFARALGSVGHFSSVSCDKFERALLGFGGLAPNLNWSTRVELELPNLLPATLWVFFLPFACFGKKKIPSQS